MRKIKSDSRNSKRTLHSMSSWAKVEIMRKGKIVKSKGMFIVLNDKGLHTRPSTELVKCAANFNAEIFLTYRNYVVNAKSILGILMLAAERGARIKVEAEGDDAEDAVTEILKLAQHRFNISY